MPASIHISTNPNHMQQMVAKHMADVPFGQSRVMLVPKGADVDYWRNLFATTYQDLAFNMKICTMYEYIRDRWNLFGDGRLISNSGIQIMALVATIQNMPSAPDEERFNPTIGTIKMLADVVRKGFGLPSMDAKLAEPENLSTPEGRIWAVLKRYRTLLDEHGFIEEGEALRNLACTLPEQPTEVAVGFSELTGCQIAFLERRNCNIFFERGLNNPAFEQIDELIGQFLDGKLALNNFMSSIASHEVGTGGTSATDNTDGTSATDNKDGTIATDNTDGTDDTDNTPGTSPEIKAITKNIFVGNEVAKPVGDVRFAFSTGVKVQPQLIAQQISRLVQDGIEPEQIYVINDTLTTTLDIQDKLRRMGISSYGNTRCSVAQTQIGKAFVGLMNNTVNMMCDFTLSKFSGISKQRAYLLGAIWLNTKGITKDKVLSDIAKESKTSAKIVKAIKQDDCGQILDAMLDALKASETSGKHDSSPNSQHQSALMAQSQAAALSIVGAIEFGRMLDLPLDLCISMLQLLDSNIKYQVVAQGSSETKCVEFGRLAAAGDKPRDAIIFADFSATSFPVSKDKDLGIQLLEKVGISVQQNYLAKMRFNFYSALRGAQKKIVFQRALADKDGNEVRPSVLFEELTDTYREDLNDFDALDKLTVLPKSITDSVKEQNIVTIKDEHLICELISKPAYEGSKPTKIMDGSPNFSVPIDPQSASEISELDRKKIALAALGTSDAPRTLSATFVESYMQCPYKWFVEKIISPQSLGCEIDALAKGNLFHGVLNGVYSEICASRGGPSRIDETTPEQIVNLVNACTMKYIEQEIRENPQSPFCNLSEKEKLDLDRYKRQICTLLEDDKEFLKPYVPSMFEKKFGKDQIFEYAGHKFSGVIDRIDIDKDGRAVIIDYKGSIGETYRFNAEQTSEDENADANPNKKIPEKMQTLLYAAAAKKVFDLDVVGLVYRSYSKSKSLCAINNLEVLGSEYMFLNKEVHGLSSAGFLELIENTELAVKDAIDNISKGIIIPAPKSKHTCKNCMAIGCKERRA